MDRRVEFTIGMQVYARSIGSWAGRDIQRVRTVTAITHRGTRAVLENGDVFLTRNGDAIKNDRISFHPYGPLVQEGWDRLNLERDTRARLGKLIGPGVDMKPFMFLPVEAHIEIAEMIERHIDAYNARVQEALNATI